MSTEIRVAPDGARPGLLLRRWRDTDLDVVVAAYSDPDQRRFTQFTVDGTADGVQWLGVQDRGWEKGDRMSFAVCEDGSDLPLGHVVLKRRDPLGDSAEVGYWTTAAARGRGIAPRALVALSDWAFATHPLRRLELIHAVANEASCRVAEKTGFHLESVLPASENWPTEDHLHVRRSGGPATAQAPDL